MQVVVTGANGKVGTAAVAALQAAGHDVLATDTSRSVFERPEPDAPGYWQADLTDAGDAFAVVRGAEAVVHTAAVPDPSHNPPHVVFHNNTRRCLLGWTPARSWRDHLDDRGRRRE